MDHDFNWDETESTKGEVFEAFGLFTFFSDSGYPEITSEIVKHSLLRSNYLPSFNGRNPEMPPLFTSDTFTPTAADCLIDIPNNRRVLGFDYARFEQMRPDGHARHSGIPHPYAHAKLVNGISQNWQDLAFLTQNQQSAIRPILMRDGRIFASEYPQDLSVEEPWVDTMRRNADFHLRLDIRNFFPSIYTHSLNWVPYGVEEGKAGLTDKTRPAAKHFSGDLDKLARFGNRNQTIGLIVGPGTSNLLAEYLLSAVDEKLFNDFGKCFRRHVDDYEFFASSKDEAQRFQRTLESALREFELYLNPLKSRLTPLSEPIEPAWKVTARSRRIDENSTVSELRAYWDSSLLDFKNHHEQVALRWSMGSILRVTKGTSNQSWALSFLIDQLRHFPYLAPYLKVVLAEETALGSTDIEVLEKIFLDRFENLYTDSRLWILTVLGLQGQISSDVISTIVEKGDSLTKCLLYEFRVASSKEILQSYSDALKTIHGADQHWLLAYQMYKGGDGGSDSDGFFEVLKSSGVDFISRTLLASF